MDELKFTHNELLENENIRLKKALHKARILRRKTMSKNNGVKASKTMKKDSGEVKSDDKLMCFLYLLGRDHMPLGVIENIMLKISDEKGAVEYSNGWLANYSQNVANRLR